ncbi:hypothetical protein BJV74DRAFT_849683 [Russula compacta]|nr:hypothetical protein BJV74DRAFT_849683 [Russula compacta]
MCKNSPDGMSPLPLLCTHVLAMFHSEPSITLSIFGWGSCCLAYNSVDMVLASEARLARTFCVPAVLLFNLGFNTSISMLKAALCINPSPVHATCAVRHEFSVSSAQAICICGFSTAIWAP